MTEAEWIAATNPYDMLMSFPAKWDHRKLWLFGCACLRRVWHLLKDQRCQSCVEIAERAFDQMPALADGFERAGFTNAEILAHCRQPGEHVRGRWVVDLLLGKEH